MLWMILAESRGRRRSSHQLKIATQRRQPPATLPSASDRKWKQTGFDKCAQQTTARKPCFHADLAGHVNSSNRTWGGQVDTPRRLLLLCAYEW